MSLVCLLTLCIKNAKVKYLNDQRISDIVGLLGSISAPFDSS